MIRAIGTFILFFGVLCMVLGFLTGFPAVLGLGVMWMLSSMFILSATS